MRLKYYLRGLGIGIIVTSLILLIAYNIRGSKVTDDEVIERATELGMIMPDNNDEDEESGKLVDFVPNETIDNNDSTGVTDDAEPTVEQDDNSNTTVIELTPSNEEPIQEPDSIDNNSDEDSTALDSTDLDGTDLDGTIEVDIHDVIDNVSVEETNVGDMVEFEILRGQVSMTVAKNLAAAGIIDDADAFNTYIQDIDYDNRIRVGKYSIAKGTDFDTIIKIITSK